MIDLELITTHSVRCRFCGYQRILSENDKRNWDIGESSYGSKKCPACSHNGPITAATGWTAGPTAGAKI